MKSLIFAGLMAASCTALAGGNIQVEESVVLDAKPAGVWALVGDYNGLYRWHPAVAKSERDGSIRVLTLGDGAQLTETLISMDNETRQYSYSLTQSPLPVDSYESSIRVERTSGGSKVIWSSSFNANGISDEEARKLISGVYKAGLGQLSELYNR